MACISMTSMGESQFGDQRTLKIKDMVLFIGLVLLLFLPLSADGYDCIERCSPRNYGTPLVAPSTEDDHCLIRLPDNPVREGNRTYPCQLAIKPNCTGYCHIHLTFSKLTLQTCEKNMTEDDHHCADLHSVRCIDSKDEIQYLGTVNTEGATITHIWRCENLILRVLSGSGRAAIANFYSCEYVMLREQGLDENGEEVSQVTRFHGDLTEGSYESKTDSVVLQFCYRSETFSGRNIQIVYRAIDPFVPVPVNHGPASVYVLGFIVVLLLIGIIMIRWSPWLKPCLDPPPQKSGSQIDF